MIHQKSFALDIMISTETGLYRIFGLKVFRDHKYYKDGLSFQGPRIQSWSALW